MSDKHLTEAGWKSLIGRLKLKDPGLSKLLSAFEKVPFEQFENRLKALGDLETEIPIAQKDKAIKGNEDAEDYLDEMEREVPRQRKVINAAKAKAEEEEEEGESGIDPAALQKKTLAMLGQIKQRGPGDVPIQFMACLAAGDSAVLLMKTVSTSTKAMLQAMLPEAQSPKFIKGDCVWEENRYTFVVDQVSGGLAEKLQKALTRSCGHKQSVRVRGTDGAALDAEADETAGSAKEPAPTTPAVDPQPAFMERLRSVKPSIEKVIAGRVAAAAELSVLVGEVAALAKAKNFAAALDKFPRLEAVIKAGLAQLEPSAVDPGGAFKARLTALLPRIKEAMAAAGPTTADIRLRAGEAGTFGRAGKFTEANAALDQVEKLLGSPIPSASATPKAEPKTEPEPELPFAEQYERAFASMEEGYLAAVKGGALAPAAEALVSRLKTIWAFATGQAEAGAHAKALSALKRITDEGLLAKIAAAKAEGPGPGMGKGSLDRRKFLLTRWKQIPGELAGQLAKLQAAIATQAPHRDGAALVGALQEYLGELVSSLQDEIDETISGRDGATSLKAARDRLTGDEVLGRLLDNPFVPGAAFRQAILQAVEEVEAKLAA